MSIYDYGNTGRNIINLSGDNDPTTGITAGSRLNKVNTTTGTVQEYIYDGATWRRKVIEMTGSVTITGGVTLAATAQVTGVLTISSGSITLASTAQITGTVTITTLVGGTQISADFTITMNSITSGNTISATFTLPAAGIQRDIAVVAYNPETADVTVNAYAVEDSLNGASRNALLATWTVPFGTTNITLLTGVFLATNLLFRVSPNSDLTTAAATALFSLRLRQKNG